jgi:hypothetical protein
MEATAVSTVFFREWWHVSELDRMTNVRDGRRTWPGSEWAYIPNFEDEL